jgi:hypothetical protein
MVVVAILGMLAAAVGVYINNIDARLRSFAFNMGSRFKQARFEAMKRGHNVYLDFDEDGDGVYNSYALWVNNNDDNVYDAWTPALDANLNGVCDEAEGDCLISDRVNFEEGVEVYDLSGAITGGPLAANGADGNPIGVGLTPSDLDDPLSTGARFRFNPGGDSMPGAIYIYSPRNVSGGKAVVAGPLAITVNSVGRIVIDEWLGNAWKKGNT